MLSDEEKEAIEYLKIEYEKLMKEDNILFPLYKSNAKRLIDIIEKQSKEIEELKKPKYVINCKTNEITKLTNDFVSKNEIKDDYVYEELSKLKDKLVKEYEAAQEGFIKKQIPTSVVDGTIVQEVGWILNEIDKILKKAESISYKVERKD